MFDVALRMVLWLLGQCITQGSRFMPSLRVSASELDEMTTLLEQAFGD